MAPPFSGSPAAPGSQLSGPLLSGPMVGDTTGTTTLLWAQARDAQPLTLRVEGPGGTFERTANPRLEDWLIAVFPLTGLTSGAAYKYTLSSAHGAAGPFQFRTLRDGARSAKIAIGSCFHFRDRTLPIFDAIAENKPDLFLMLGDNAYYEEADWQNEHTKMLCQLAHRNNKSLLSLLRRVPTLAVWDDHDYGPNNADSTYSGKPSSLSAFRRMWPQPPGGLPGTEGLFFSRRVGPVEIFLLDVRTHRIRQRQVLGAAQLTWLLQGLRSSTAPVKLVASGSQVLPDAPAAVDWESFRLDGPKEVDQLLKAIDDFDIKGVVFATGDVHIGYLLRRAGKRRPDGRVSADLWELTSSPLANDPWHEDLLHKIGPHDPSIVREVVAVNYGLIDVDLDRAGSEIALSLRDEKGRPLAERTVPLASTRARPAPKEKMSVVVWPNGKAFFFKGDRYVRWDIAAGCADPGYPKPVAPYWKGLGDGRFDAAVVWTNKKAYFFEGNGYVAYLVDADKVGSEIRYIARYWRGLWQDGVDAAVVWNNGKAFFFKGSEYIRYDIAADRADPGYPKSIASGWPGVWTSGIESAALFPNGKACFFKGSEYIQYDVANDRADPGYPRPISSGFPGLFDDGVA
jgi:alkaline phosphatase D